MSRRVSARAPARGFDAVVLDLTVAGGKGGVETLAELRRLDASVRAVLSSGHASELVAGHRALGFSAVLAKPYGAPELRDALAAALAEARGAVA